MSLIALASWHFKEQEPISTTVQESASVADEASDDWRSVLAWFGPDGDAADEQLAALAFRFRAAGIHCTLSIHHNVCCIAVKPRDLPAARKLAIKVIDDQPFA